MFISRDVQFHENIFPFHDSFARQNSWSVTTGSAPLPVEDEIFSAILPHATVIPLVPSLIPSTLSSPTSHVSTNSPDGQPMMST